MTDIVDDFLAHNGVKGMHWGVRKAEDPSNPKSSKELVKAAKKNYGEQSDPILEARISRQFGSGSKLNYSELSNKKVSINAGKQFYRLTQHSDESMRQMTYVSTNVADRERYRMALAKTGFAIAKQSYKANNYEATYKSVKKLTSPSEKERVDAFTSLLDSRISVGKRGRTVNGRRLLAKAGYGSTLGKVDRQRFGEKYYYEFASNQYMKSPINTAYFNSIKAKGYNALIDDNDRNIVSKEPLMILDPQGSIKQISIKRLTNDEINKTMSTFTAVQNDKKEG